MDEKYGGGGSPDYRYYLILNEELARAGAHGPGFSVHNDIIGQYLRARLARSRAVRALAARLLLRRDHHRLSR